MAEATTKKSFTGMMNEVFRLPGQALKDFATELRALTQEDKEWYPRELVKGGYDCLPPTPVTQA